MEHDAPALGIVETLGSAAGWKGQTAMTDDGKSQATRPRDDGLTINVRIGRDLLASLDRWIEGLAGAELSRPEAIRRLVEMGLSNSPNLGRLSDAARAHASAMAGDVVDQLTDSMAPEEEQQQRKHKLIHGPREFREMRRDQHRRKAEASGGPKAKS